VFRVYENQRTRIVGNNGIRRHHQDRTGESRQLEVVLKSSVANEFGKQIVQTIRSAADEYGLEYAVINAVDKGALDCTIRARVAAACQRATQTDAFDWGKDV
jgi:citrate lyase subunit gamma (acyl carrier protein)